MAVPFFLIAFVVLLNFGISFWNARAVGLMWVETKQIGGFTRFMTWMGWIMSASGFTWCYLVILLFGAYYGQPAFIKPGQPMLITQENLMQGFSLGYLIILPGILFSGLMIWVDSLVQAWRRRDATSIGIAAWNTFAQVHNTYSAIQGVPQAMKAVGGLFAGKGDARGKVLLLIIALVAAAVVSGVLTTMAIVAHYAGSRPLPSRNAYA